MLKNKTRSPVRAPLVCRRLRRICRLLAAYFYINSSSRAYAHINIYTHTHKTYTRTHLQVQNQRRQAAVWLPPIRTNKQQQHQSNKNKTAGEKKCRETYKNSSWAKLTRLGLTFFSAYVVNVKRHSLTRAHTHTDTHTHTDAYIKHMSLPQHSFSYDVDVTPLSLSLLWLLRFASF